MHYKRDASSAGTHEQMWGCFQSLDAYKVYFPSLLTLILKTNSQKQPLGPIMLQREVQTQNVLTPSEM